MTELPPTHSPPHNNPSPILIVFLIFPVLGILAALVLVLSEQQSAAEPLSTPLPVEVTYFSLIDQPAPNFALNGLEGESYRLSSYRGRVVFVNFWATWCEPCQRELPTFERFTAEQGDGGAVILAVNVGETPGQIREYFDEHDIGRLNVLLDERLEVYSAYDIQRMPTTFVLDPTGVVRYMHLGEMTEDDLVAYVETVGG